jgi:hypothetical protein
MTNENEFDLVFKKLKAIFAPYAKKMDAACDTPDYYVLNTRHIMKNKQPLCFGGVRKGKAYVSFHLFAVYACTDLLTEMSPELKKRMQGKSCFNFKTVDEKLFKELAQLTKAGAAKFSDGKFVDTLRKAQGDREKSNPTSPRSGRQRVDDHPFRYLLTAAARAAGSRLSFISEPWGSASLHPRLYADTPPRVDREPKLG